MFYSGEFSKRGLATGGILKFPKNRGVRLKHFIAFLSPESFETFELCACQPFHVKRIPTTACADSTSELLKGNF
jgi:hypothetical protein